MKLNFDEVEVYTDLAKENKVVQNIRKEFANFIYVNGKGIASHAVALKIYNGNPETDFTPQEVDMIRSFSQGCAPCVIDAITDMIAKSGGIPMEVAQ